MKNAFPKNAQYAPIHMEEYFQPGFLTKPAVFVGSQTVPFFHGNQEEQAWEGFCLVGTSGKDVAVVRNFDPHYIEYWKNLIDDVHVINIQEKPMGKYLTEVILENPDIIASIKRGMASNAKLIPFISTSFEEKLAKALNIPLHGSSKINSLYGTKSGIRRLAMKYNLPMAPGYICSTASQIYDAATKLSKHFDEFVIKHDLSLSGYFSKRLQRKQIKNIKLYLNKIANGHFTDGKDIVVIEGWIKSRISLCAHIEILENKEPIIASAWQQIIADDGISYIGAGPLMLSKKAMQSFLTQVNKLAKALKEKGAVGSFGPDFLIISDDEKNLEPDTCVLTELNARAPYTAYPLELVKQIKGKVGSGFCTTHVKLKTSATFSEIKNVLEKERLLIGKKDSKAKGVVPYNIGLLPWKIFDIIAIGDSWKEVEKTMSKAQRLFS